MRHSLIALMLLPLLDAQAADFMYRGQLEQAEGPAHGIYDMQLRLHATAQGEQLLSVIQLDDVAVADGRFAVPVEFHGLSTALESGWLEVAVREAGGSEWVRLAGRSKVALGSQVCPASWELEGNALTDPGLNFLGTTDASALELRVANQRGLRIDPVDLDIDGRVFDTPNLIGGGQQNLVEAGSSGSTIAGGGGMSSGGFVHPNLIRAFHSFIGSGTGNRVEPISGPFPQLPPIINAAVVGGHENIANANGAFIGGGFFGSARGVTSVVGGGFENSANGSRSAVLGGEANLASGSGSAVLGGLFNSATGAFAAVPNGSNNTAGGDFSFAAGRRAKVRTREEAGEDFFCLDSRTCGDEGSFVWADSLNADFQTTGPNQFLVRAAGGMGLGTNSPNAQLHVLGTVGGRSAVFESASSNTLQMVAGVANSATLQFRDPELTRAQLISFSGGTFTLQSEGAIQMRTGGNTTRFQLTADGGLSLRRGPGGPDADKAIQVGTNTSTGNGAHLTNTGVWTNASSRHFKQDFEAIDPRAVLERLLQLPVQAWRYQGESAVRHMGPTAEDFRAAFGLGGDERYIGSVDADGVALAAIQGLNAKLEAENAALRARLERLEAVLLGSRETHQSDSRPETISP